MNTGLDTCYTRELYLDFIVSISHTVVSEDGL
jgi:hypothetical protein